MPPATELMRASLARGSTLVLVRSISLPEPDSRAGAAPGIAVADGDAVAAAPPAV